MREHAELELRNEQLPFPKPGKGSYSVEGTALMLLGVGIAVASCLYGHLGLSRSRIWRTRANHQLSPTIQVQIISTFGVD
jgi:hypothetical protein